MLEHELASQISIVLFMTMLLTAAFADIAYYKIPNVVVLSIVALYPFYVLVNPQPVSWLPALGVAGAALVVGFGLFALKIFGAGDIKLIAAVLLWAGPGLALLTLLICTLAGGAIALIMMSRVKFLVAGALSRFGQESLGKSLLAKNMPYGVAIASSGFFVGWSLFTAA